VAGNSLRIVLRPSALGRFALLKTYLRIESKKLLVEIFKKRITEERVFSQNVCFGDYRTFVILFEEICLTGVYWFRAAGAAPLIVDGGANIGLSVAYFKTIYPACRIVAFEADSRNFALLAGNAKRNSWSDLELHNLGLHRGDGELLFYDYNDVPGALSGGFWQPPSAGAPKRVLRLRTVPLSRYIDRRVDLLKLDIEGSEHAVLEDLEANAKLAHIEQIILEYHHHVQPREDRLGGFLSLLERAGFGYHVCARLALPFPREETQNFMIGAYAKRVLNESQ
jgi:FkbM family methyltransferase